MSKGRRELVSFKDVVNGNVSEDILKASSITQSQEKVYELERVEGSCQTPELSAVNIAPISYHTLSSEEIHTLRDMSKTTQTGTPENDSISVKPTLPTPSLTAFPERSEVIKLMTTVTEEAKAFRQKMNIVRDRRQLKAEQEADEREARAASEARLEKRMNDYALSVDEAKMVLDNLVTHFQGLSSRYNSEAERGE